MNWKSQAACTGMPVEIFYRDCRPSRSVKDICSSCAVRTECLAEALAVETLGDLACIYGYRGGKSADERRHLLRKMRHDAIHG